MRMNMSRTVLTVSRTLGVWSVEQEGEVFGHSPDKQVAQAAANRRAREIQDGGKPCQVRVAGETGFWS